MNIHGAMTLAISTGTTVAITRGLWLNDGGNIALVVLVEGTMKMLVEGDDRLKPNYSDIVSSDWCVVPSHVMSFLNVESIVNGYLSR